MKEEVKRWMSQALADLNAAKKNIQIKIYYLSVQCSHQAAEKALKALFIKKFNKIPEKTHMTLLN
ncbi:HEPN domain-containing protein [Candidatus Woesearchaeota archaeon]|nr:HEPN domain-containing protein [Candidatus Woesearchaeota archaeon]